MSAQAWPAQGTTFAIDEAYPPSGTYTLIGQVLSIGGAGGGSVGERNTTILTSTVHSSAPTIPDNGEVKISTNHDPTDSAHKFVRGLKDAPPGPTEDQFNNFKVVFNDSASTNDYVTFPGWVKDWEGVNAEGVDENLAADITIRVSGAVTWGTA